MRYFLFVLVFLTNILTATVVKAQEAKLVEYSSWGSGRYLSHVELNGFNYILTNANKIDVIDPSIQGKDSLIKSIDMFVEAEYESFQYVTSGKLSKFNNNLVFQGHDRVKIYKVEEDHKFTLFYSMSIEPYVSFKSFEQNGKLYLFDNMNQVHVVEEDDNGFKVTSSELGVDLRNTYSSKVFSDDQYYFIVLTENSDNSNTTYVHKYDIETQSLLKTFNYESDKPAVFTYVDDEKFIIESNQQWLLLSVQGDTIQELNKFNNDVFEGYYYFHVEDGKLHAISRYGYSYFIDYYIYSIADTGNVTLISQQSLVPLLPNSAGGGSLEELTFKNGKWLGLSENYGEFEVSVISDVVTEIKPYFNPSGNMGKVAVINNKAYAPRGNRIDVVDISNTFELESSFYTQAKDAINYNELLLTTSWYDVSIYAVNVESTLELQSTISSDYHSAQLIINSYLFTADFDNEGWKLHRYNIDNLNETPVEIDIPDSEGFCGNTLGLAVVKEQLAIVEDCSKSVILFSNYDTANIKYYQTLANSYSDSRFAVKNDFLYFTDNNNFNVAIINDLNEIEKIAEIDFPQNSDSDIFWYPKLTVVGEYLLASYDSQIYLYDLSQPESPKFISNTKLNGYSPLAGGEFQLTDNYISYANEVEGRFSLFTVNNAPFFVSNHFEINEDTPINLDEVVKDLEDDPFSFEVIVAPEHGKTSNDDINLYTPVTNYFGEDKFTIKIEDVHGNFNEQEVSVSILSVNDAPVINTSEINVIEDTKFYELLSIIDFEDDQLSYSINEQPMNGSASFNDLGQLTYIPNTNYFGSDSIKVLVTDIHGASTSKVINILVESVNDLPVLMNSSFEGQEDTASEGQLTASDIEEHAMRFSVIAGSSVNGQVSIESSGRFVFTPDDNFFGQASFIAQVTDAEQGVDQQTIIINIEGSDDIPVAESINTTVNNNSSAAGVLAANDADGDSLLYSVVTNVVNGTLSLSSSGEYSYTPNEAYTGTDSLIYQVGDGKNNVQGSITFTVKAAPVAQSNEASSGGSMSYIFIMLTLGLVYCRKLKGLSLP